jgi:hypothetical protein
MRAYIENRISYESRLKAVREGLNIYEQKEIYRMGLNKKISEIDELFWDKLDKDGKYSILYSFIAYIWFIPRNFISVIHYRIFLRGMCALKGCDTSYACGWYLPDDVCEWHCKRCHAEGINHIVYSQELFFGDNKLYDFIMALKGK